MITTVLLFQCHCISKHTMNHNSQMHLSHTHQHVKNTSVHTSYSLSVCQSTYVSSVNYHTLSSHIRQYVRKYCQTYLDIMAKHMACIESGPKMSILTVVFAIPPSTFTSLNLHYCSLFLPDDQLERWPYTHKLR